MKLIGVRAYVFSLRIQAVYMRYFRHTNSLHGLFQTYKQSACVISDIEAVYMRYFRHTSSLHALFQTYKQSTCVISDIKSHLQKHLMQSFVSCGSCRVGFRQFIQILYLYYVWLSYKIWGQRIHAEQCMDDSSHYVFDNGAVLLRSVIWTWNVVVKRHKDDG
jgi:hypothetical protein